MVEPLPKVFFLSSIVLLIGASSSSDVIECLGDDLFEALFPPSRGSFENKSEMTAVVDVSRSVGMRLFMFGEGPLDLTCSDPFVTAAALESCDLLAMRKETSSSVSLNKDTKQDLYTAVTQLCSEEPASHKKRLFHCLSMSSAPLTVATSEIRRQSLYCRLSLTCHRFWFNGDVCTRLVSASRRKETFCSLVCSAKGKAKMVRQCERRWDGVLKRGKLDALREALLRDVLNQHDSVAAVADVSATVALFERLSMPFAKRLTVFDVIHNTNGSSPLDSQEGRKREDFFERVLRFLSTAHDIRSWSGDDAARSGTAVLAMRFGQCLNHSSTSDDPGDDA